MKPSSKIAFGILLFASTLAVAAYFYIHGPFSPREAEVNEALTYDSTEVAPDSSARRDNNPGKEIKSYKETRIRFRNFTLVMQGFVGYHLPDPNYSGDVSDVDTSALSVNYSELYIKPTELKGDSIENSDYIETLVARKDTIPLIETSDYDYGFSDCLLQFIPNNKDDRFKLSFCYLGVLREVVDWNGKSEAYMDSLYKKTYRRDMQSPYWQIADSAGLNFHLLPKKVDSAHSLKRPENRENLADSFYDWSDQYYSLDHYRIKKEFGMHDTNLIIPGECGDSADMAKKGVPYTYDYHTYFIKIERFRNNKKQETKYLKIEIFEDC